MKFELHIDGPETAIVLAEMLPKLAQAMQADRDRYLPRSSGEAVVSTHAFGKPAPAAEEAPADAAPKPLQHKSAARYYGKAWDGRARRTKEEIAEDKELDELRLALGKSEADLASGPVDRLLILWREESNSETIVEEAPAIRTNPEDRRPVAEAVAEAPDAEVADVPQEGGVDAPPVEERVYTREDVKAALSAYAQKFGMAAAQQNGAGLIGAAKISLIPEDPAAFRKAVLALEAATAGGVDD